METQMHSSSLTSKEISGADSLSVTPDELLHLAINEGYDHDENSEEGDENNEEGDENSEEKYSYIYNIPPGIRKLIIKDEFQWWPGYLLSQPTDNNDRTKYGVPDNSNWYLIWFEIRVNLPSSLKTIEHHYSYSEWGPCATMVRNICDVIHV